MGIDDVHVATIQDLKRDNGGTEEVAFMDHNAPSILSKQIAHCFKNN